MADVSPPPTSESEPVSPGELDSLQAGARWLVGSSAAVLAVLVASVQLSSLADVASNGGQELSWTLLLSVLALGAVGAILILAARVLVRPGWTVTKLSTLATEPNWSKHWLKDELDTHRALLMPDIHGAVTAGPPPSLRPDALYGHHSRLLRAWFELHEKKSTSVTGDLLDENSNTVTNYNLASSDDVEHLERRMNLTANATAKLAALANLLDVRRRYRRLVYWQLPLLGGLAVLAVLGLVWLAAENAEVSITGPVQVDVKFTNDIARIQEAGIPVTCRNLVVRGVAINGTLSKPVVSSVATPSCLLSQTEISQDVGTVVPILPPK